MGFKEPAVHWKPVGNKIMTPGTTDLKSASSPSNRTMRFKAPTNTTAQRTSQAVMNHWVRQSSHQEDDPQGKTPDHTAWDGDVNQHEEYRRNRELAWRNSAQLGPGGGEDQRLRASMTLQGQQVLDEYQGHRTRGIPGYTGTAPKPDQRRPAKVEEATDPSRLYGRGGSSERKPWSKGIPGYTGRQPAVAWGEPGSTAGRGVFMMDQEVAPEPEDPGGRSTFRRATDGEGESVSSPLSGASQSSHRKLRQTPMHNTPEDIARRKVEEALAFGDGEVQHEGSAATLRLSTRYHKAPNRGTGGPKDPVDRPRQWSASEGKGAWKHTASQRPQHDLECQFDWFLEQPLPVDKRPEPGSGANHWRQMSEMIDHTGSRAGHPRVSYGSVQHLRKSTAYGGVRNMPATAAP
mmetsp:Transcript_17437/g.41709  ORF Transcript_17437/g.41709 Transcript_17437/m.41709 type:complete len:405 (+) Transcript_17437:82-1296(+)